MSVKLGKGARARADLPFKIVRNSRKTLVEQVSDGLRTCILSGHYSSGDILPTIRDLAEMLGVSDIVTRAAIRTLAQEDLVQPRPKTGIEVLGRAGKTWKGRILLVTRSNGRTYYVNVFTAALREKLVKAGWELALATVAPGTRPDLSELELQLAHPTDLAVVMFENPAAERLLSRMKAPFVSVGNAGERSAANRGRVEIDRSAASERFAAACQKAGVRSVLEVGCERFSDVDAALRKAGIAVMRQAVRIPQGALNPEGVVRTAHATFLRLLAAPTGCKADCIYFSDDYLCRGALVALMQTGVRVPEDVRIATWATCGNVPIYAKELSRLEIDPQTNAVKVADFCCRVLADGMPVETISLGPAYVEGETV